MSSVNYPCPTWKYPGRTCQKKTEDTLCAAARKICQKDCSNINSDASGYIARDYERIQQIDSAIAQNNSQLVYNSTLTENNDKFIANQTALCADIQKSHDEYLQNVTIQRAFVVSLYEISNSSNSSDLSAQIDNSPKFSQIEKTILKNFIKATNASTIDLQTLIGQYKKEMFEAFEKVLSTALDASMADCETQKYQISTQTQILSNQKDEINADNNVLSAERQSKISDILSQEVRKCTPG